MIHLKDIVKGGIKERFAQLRKMGIKTVMITGDNPLTAAAIAAEAGVDDFLAQATPEAKLKLIREYQAGGRLVAMTGDGTNDAPALAQADVAVAMNTGTQPAREAANMVDLDSNPTKLIEIVEIGKQLLMTRGALTTFSIANDVSKYFAIIPAAFASTYPALGALNIMRLATPQSAILSAVIFNALIIIALIPLALRGVPYRAGRRGPAAARQPADLRPGRPDRPVYRHQADRPAPGGTCTWFSTLQTSRVVIYWRFPMKQNSFFAHTPTISANSLLAVLTVAATTIPLFLIGRDTLGEAVIALLYLVPVTWSANRWGQLPGISAALTAALAFDFLFIPPSIPSPWPAWKAGWCWPSSWALPSWWWNASRPA